MSAGLIHRDIPPAKRHKKKRTFNCITQLSHYLFFCNLDKKLCEAINSPAFISEIKGSQVNDILHQYCITTGLTC